MPTFTLGRYESLRLVGQWEHHRSICGTCRSATNVRGACPRGQKTHDAMVRDSHARRSLQPDRPIWSGHLMLDDIRTPKHLADWLGERRLAAASTVAGIDVSIYQGAFDWGAAVAAGVGLGIAKASEGNGFTDPQWGHNLSALLAPGPIVPGSYHFARPDLGNTPQAEADWYLSRHPAACFDPSVPWIFSLDAESAGGSAAWVYAWLDTVSQRIGYSAWFYSFANWITSRGVKAFNRPLWLAWPDPSAPPTEGWPALTCQQTGTRSIGGVSVDADTFFGSPDQLLALAGTGGIDMAIGDDIYGQLVNDDSGKPLSPDTARMSIELVRASILAGKALGGDDNAIGDNFLGVMLRQIDAKLDALKTTGISDAQLQALEAALVTGLTAALPAAEAPVVAAAVKDALGKALTA